MERFENTAQLGEFLAIQAAFVLVSLILAFAYQSSRWIVFGTIWGFLALLATLFFFTLNPVTVLAGTFFTALFGFAFVHNLILGPTCIVRLRTAVQTHRISPLERMRDFRKGMDAIEPLIRAAQQTD